jgi:squalene-associated FAD-dependent desaturase
LQQKIIIIGAGVAGLTAAVNLAGSGYPVSVLEARPNIGGRMFSVRDNVSGEMIDNGQHLLSAAYSEFLSVLEKLGTSVYLKRTKGLSINFADVQGQNYSLNTSLFRGNSGVLAGLLKFNALSFASKLNLISFFLKLKTKKLKFDDLSCFDLFKREHQSDEVIKIFWEPLTLAVLNNNPRNVAASLLVEVLERAFFAGGGASELLLPLIDLSVLLQPAFQWLERNGGEIKLRTKVRKIIIEDGKACGVELQNNEKISADSIISTVPPHILMKLLPENEKLIRNLSDFEYSTIINVYYWLDKHIETPDFTALIGTNSQWLFNRRNFVAVDGEIRLKYPGMINITISGANSLADMPSETIADECFSELKQCIPAFAGCQILHSRVIKDKFATVSLDTAAERRRPGAESGVKGLYLAGDWTNTKLPATIESAAISGKKAADYVLKQHI